MNVEESGKVSDEQIKWKNLLIKFVRKRLGRKNGSQRKQGYMDLHMDKSKIQIGRVNEMKTYQRFMTEKKGDTCSPLVDLIHLQLVTRS